MDEDWIETERKTAFQLDVPSRNGDEVRILCPACSGDRKKSQNKDLSLNVNLGTGYCHHCGKSFVRKKEDDPRPINNKPKSSARVSAKISPRALNEVELAYWQQCKILPGILDIYGVKALDSYQVGSHKETTEPGNPIFCYEVGPGSWKIYRPNAREGQNKFCWVGNKPDDWYFGLEYCKGSTRVYLVGGEKDVLTMVSQGLEAFTLNSETAKMPSDLAKRLDDQYMEVVVLYDNDPTGIKHSREICQEFGFTRAYLPEGNKDISDLIASGGSIEDIRYEDDSFLITRTADQWIEEGKATAPRKELFGPFIKEGEVVMGFGPPSSGKSVLAYQIADGICRGEDVLGFPNEAGPMTCLYLDCELHVKQFEERSTDQVTGESYKYPLNLYRSQINPDSDLDDAKLEALIFTRTKKEAKRLGARFVVIDNLSWLHSEPEKAKNAVPLMRRLWRWTRNTGVTVLVINHPVKIPKGIPINENHMAGSKMLHNLCDMMFAIGFNHHNQNHRYLKMVKGSRTSGEFYGEQRVVCIELVKTDRLYFQYLTEAKEVDLLPSLDNKAKDPRNDQKVAAQVLKVSGQSNVEIAKLLGVTEGTIRQWLK
jgi:hypothetical protein